jgi:hypothetical protein
VRPVLQHLSQADKLTDEDTTHWTGKPHRLTSMVRIDGKPYRVMGATPGKAPAMKQTGLTVLPTRTIYTFEDAGIALTLTFLTPALPENIDMLSRPVTYLTYESRSTDGKSHEVQVYFDASAELTVNTSAQQVEWSPEEVGDLAVCKIGSKAQPILAKSGDDIRIDWGYLYIAAPKDAVTLPRIRRSGRGAERIRRERPAVGRRIAPDAGGRRRDQCSGRAQACPGRQETRRLLADGRL